MKHHQPDKQQKPTVAAALNEPVQQTGHCTFDIFLWVARLHK